MEQILVINPGSTSTKIAYYEGSAPKWSENMEHDPGEIGAYKAIYDQLEMRTRMVRDALAAHGEAVSALSAVVSRGGLLPPVASGAYEVTPLMIETLRERPVNHHASNLGCAIAYDIAGEAGVKAYIYDPVTVDEMIDLVRITGLRDIVRHGQGHNLNMRAAAMNYCAQRGMDYHACNLLVAHLGGGITLSLHQDGRIVDMVSDDEGAFSPERAGEMPAFLLLRKVFSEGLDYAGAMKLLQRKGGLMSHFGTSDCRQVEQMADAGDARAKLVLEAMALSVARALARLAVVVDGKIDAIVLTGGIAYSKSITEEIARRVAFIAPVAVIPGENEMQALADGALRVLRGEEKARVYE